MPDFMAVVSAETEAAIFADHGGDPPTDVQIVVGGISYPAVLA